MNKTLKPNEPLCFFLSFFALEYNLSELKYFGLHPNWESGPFWLENIIKENKF